MMKETDCPTCKYPSVQQRDRLSEVCQFIVPRQSNTMIVPNYGHIPVLKGDISWLSPEVSIFLNECVQLMTPTSLRICNGSVFEAQELRDAVSNEFGSEEQKMLNRLHLNISDIGLDDIHVVTKEKIDAETGNLANSSTGHASKYGSNENTENSRLSTQYMSSKHFEFAKEQRFTGCMTGRTMYLVPFSMGWIGSRHAVVGIQITDDPVLVLNLRATFRVLSSVWDCIAATTTFLKSVHSIGMPRPIIRRIVFPTPPETPTGSNIVLKHDEQQIWTHGYPFGRTPRFGKTLSIHAASWIGTKRGWLAEKAAILSLTNPKNQTIHVCYSSLTDVESLQLATGLTPGWKIEVLSEKTVWIHWYNGKMHALAPENDEMDDMGSQKNLSNLFNGTTSEYQIQSFNPQKTKWPSDVGVPISAYVFANRRHDQYPLILEANTWEEGVCLAAGIRVSVPKAKSDSFESTANESNSRSTLVECPMLRPDSVNFSFTKYVNHWLEMGVGIKSSSSESSETYEKPFAPPIFFTNLYQETEGKVIWPGGVDNAKIFEYIFARCTSPSDLTNTTSSGIGKVPKNLELSALVNLPPLLQVNIRFWLTELNKLRTFFNIQMEGCLPPQLEKVLTDLAGNI